MNIVITSRSSKINFCNNCNSIEMYLDESDHQIFINSKCHDVNELNVINNKVNYFWILHLNIASLNKHIDILSSVLSLMNINFPIIGLSQHKIREILLSIIPPYQVILSALMKRRAPMVALVST